MASSLFIDNTIFYLQPYGGISTYWNELNRRVLVDTDFDCVFTEMHGLSPRCKERVALPQYMQRFERHCFPLVSRYLPIDSRVFQGAKGLLHSSYYRTARVQGIQNMVTVYDFTYEKYVKGLKRSVHCWQKRSALKNAAAIICISENTRRDMQELYPEVAKTPTKVIPLAASSGFSAAPRNHHDYLASGAGDTLAASAVLKGLKGRRILTFVGRRDGYKNFRVAVALIKRLSSEYHLLIVGGGALKGEELAELGQASYTYLSNIDSQELNQIYNLSFCYLYPSEYEGFGIPILEAMQAGCPVLCQRSSSIPEVYGNVGNLVEHGSIEEFHSNLLKLEDPMTRQAIINQGFDNVKRFSWAETMSQTFEFYRLFF